MHPNARLSLFLAWNARSPQVGTVRASQSFFKVLQGSARFQGTGRFPRLNEHFGSTCSEKAQPQINFAHFRVVTRTSTPAVTKTVSNEMAQATAPCTSGIATPQKIAPAQRGRIRLERRSAPK